jgi:hypothetical protein
MKSLIIPVAAAAALALSAPVLAQEAQEPPAPAPLTTEQQAEQARLEAINTYVRIRFAKEVEDRCKHLDKSKRAEFRDDVSTVDNYMEGMLSEEIMDAVQKNASAAGKDAQRNPCGEDSKEFVEQSAMVTAKISDSIEQSAE